MSFELRPARATDRSEISAFTEGTFEWGDYVADRFDSWLEVENGHMIVATADDVVVGLARGVLLSPSELWLHAARVHPDWRGKGVGGLLNEGLIAWGKEQGAGVARLLIENWNDAAQKQVAKGHYRPVSQWAFGKREISPDDPNPMRNGGKRVPGPERLQAASRSEAEPAFLAWSTSNLLRAARGLFGFRWSWRRLTIDDLALGAKSRTFFECPSGWVLMSRTAEGVREVAWAMATPDDVTRLVRAVLDYSLSERAAELHFHMPATVEVLAALERIGCTVKLMTIWERAIDVD